MQAWQLPATSYRTFLRRVDRNPYNSGLGPKYDAYDNYNFFLFGIERDTNTVVDKVDVHS